MYSRPERGAIEVFFTSWVCLNVRASQTVEEHLKYLTSYLQMCSSFSFYNHKHVIWCDDALTMHFSLLLTSTNTPILIRCPPALSWGYSKPLLCLVVWGLSSAMPSSWHNKPHSPEREINPPKTECVCKHGGGRWKRSHTQSSHPMDCTCTWICMGV